MNKSKLTEVSMIALTDYSLTQHARKRKEERLDELTSLGYSVGNPYKMFCSDEDDRKGYMITDKGIVYVLDLVRKKIITVIIASRAQMRMYFDQAGLYTPYNILSVCSLHEEEHICNPTNAHEH